MGITMYIVEKMEAPLSVQITQINAQEIII